MRKLKVIKSWPGGPNVGAELHEDSKGNFGLGFGYSENELEGFVEEIKEPEGFWWAEDNGDVEDSKQFPNNPSVASIHPGWRFRTKESAEKFSNALKEKVELFPTIFQGANDSYILVPRGNATKVAYDILSALNDRVK